MKFALLNGVKTEAQLNLTAHCPNCGKTVRSYCGNQTVHHWKHIQLKECDDWYERETAWHRNWKNHFDIKYQEVIRFDQETNEKHVADIYNSEKDVVLEFQHSSLTTYEIQARELFYDRMIWVIDLISFIKNLEFINRKSKIQTALRKMRNSLSKNFMVPEDFIMNESQNEAGKFLDSIGLNKVNTMESYYISKLEEKYTLYVIKKIIS